MAPRVKFVGETADAVEMEDEKGGRYSIPKQVIRTALPPQYEDELTRGFAAFKASPPEVQEAERKAYNEVLVAGGPRGDLNAPLPYDEQGRQWQGVTRTRYPEAAPFESLNEQRLLGPTPEGPSLSSRPPVQVGMAVQPGNVEAMRHEGLHAQAADPTEGEMQKRYTSMGPREREQWRVFTALNHGAPDAPGDEPGKRSHRPHAMDKANQSVSFNEEHVNVPPKDVVRARMRDAAVNELRRKLGLI